MVKKSSPSRVEDRKQEIIDASYHIFSKYGYKKTTITSIAEEIGINQATIYHYFKNKDDIFIESLINQFTSLKERLKNLIDSNSPIKTKIIDFFKIKLHFLDENPIPAQLAELHLKEKFTSDQREKILELSNQEYLAVSFLLNEAKRSGELNITDTNQMANILIHLSQGIRYGNQLRRFFSQEKPTLDEMIAEMEQSIRNLFSNFST